jgi:hypothetical protein
MSELSRQSNRIGLTLIKGSNDYPDLSGLNPKIIQTN